MKLFSFLSSAVLLTLGLAESYDYIIVGAGTTGSVLANRLTEDPSVSVLLLERSSDFQDPSPIQATRALRLYYATNNIYDISEQYFSTPNLSNLGIKNKMKIAKGVGGSTLTSNGEYSRPFNFDFDAWGVTGWTASDVVPYFMKAETVVNVRHGAPQSTEDDLLISLQNIGVPVPADGNSGNSPVGAFKASYTLSDFFQKETAKSAYLDPIVGVRTNLKIETNARVTKILVDEYSTPKVATGVSYSKAGSIINVKANKEVIICAGPYESPKLLELSGIGNSAILTSQGIPVIQDLPEVGENLITKPTIKMIYSGVNYYPEQNLTMLSDPAVIGQYLSGNGGLYAVPQTSVQILFPVNGVDGFFEYGTVTDPFEAFPTSQFVSVSVASPLSRGNVHINSPNPFTRPSINNNLYSNQGDLVSMLTLVSGIAQFLDLSGTGPFMGTPIVNYGDYFTVMAQTTPFRQSQGTCRMGDDNTAVVNRNLIVNGFDNLRVVDSSIFPNSIKTGLIASLYMLAEKAADMIKAADYTINIDYSRGYTICKGVHGHALVLSAQTGKSNVCDEIKSRGVNLAVTSLCESDEAANVIDTCSSTKVWLKPVDGVCRTFDKNTQLISTESCSNTYPVLCKA